MSKRKPDWADKAAEKYMHLRYGKFSRWPHTDLLPFLSRALRAAYRRGRRDEAKENERIAKAFVETKETVPL